MNVFSCTVRPVRCMRIGNRYVVSDTPQWGHSWTDSGDAPYTDRKLSTLALSRSIERNRKKIRVHSQPAPKSWNRRRLAVDRSSREGLRPRLPNDPERSASLRVRLTVDRAHQAASRVSGCSARRILVAGWWPRGMKHQARSHGKL